MVIVIIGNLVYYFVSWKVFDALKFGPLILKIVSLILKIEIILVENSERLLQKSIILDL